jgi:hypothetical protein
MTYVVRGSMFWILQCERCYDESIFPRGNRNQSTNLHLLNARAQLRFSRERGAPIQHSAGILSLMTQLLVRGAWLHLFALNESCEKVKKHARKHNGGPLCVFTLIKAQMLALRPVASKAAAHHRFCFSPFIYIE